MAPFVWFVHAVRTFRRPQITAFLVVSLTLMLASACPLQAQTHCTVKVDDFATHTICTGTFPDPAWRPWSLDVPTDWNGTLVLFGQGYAYPGSAPLLATKESVDQTLDADTWGVATGPWGFGEWLLHNGYAMASCLAGTGWAVGDALHFEIQTLDTFSSLFGPPTRTIAYGGSLGGIITAGLIQQHPERFAGALSVCGVLGGSVGSWNELLDFAFGVQQLLEPTLQIVQITNPGTPTSGNFGRALQVLDAAQSTAQGRARIALACALVDLPGWFDPLTPEPAADDYSAREYNQYLSATGIAALAFGLGRVDIERRVQGNPSWNTEVNYEAQLEKSISHAEVVALYQAAGLSLEDDLARLKAAPRIAADPEAVERLSEDIVFNGELTGVPILTVHTTDDPLITNQHESAYRSAVLEAQDLQLLRQTFVHRAGHGAVTTAELIAAFQALIRRMETGRWQGNASPEELNAAALALGPSYNVLMLGGGYNPPMPPAYVNFDPAPFLRPYDLADRDATPPSGHGTRYPAVPLVKGETPVDAAQPLSAWPLPYRGGSLQVSFAPGARPGTDATVSIYDLSGRQVRVLAGNRGGSLRWDGRDGDGVAVRDGVYFLRATSAGRSAQLKIAVVR